MSTIVGTVAEVWRFPLKSMAGERLEGGHIAADGLVGDRGWAVRDEKAGEIRGARKLPKLMLCSARYLDEPHDGVVPQEGLPRDPSVLRTIVRDAGQNVGVYGSVVRGGHVRVGDEVRLA